MTPQKLGAGLVERIGSSRFSTTVALLAAEAVGQGTADAAAGAGAQGDLAAD